MVTKTVSVLRCFQWNTHLTGLVRLLRLLLPFCYGFVTGQTSISLPFYRDVTGVTAQREGKGGISCFDTLCIHTLQRATVNPLLHSTENSEEPLTGKTPPGGLRRLLLSLLLP